jgi:hypothetical protein
MREVARSEKKDASYWSLFATNGTCKKKSQSERNEKLTNFRCSATGSQRASGLRGEYIVETLTDADYAPPEVCED